MPNIGDPPYLPLRAGPSGPEVDLSFYLERINGIIQIRRLWYKYQGSVTVPAGTSNPGLELIKFDVPWGAEELDLAGRLKYPWLLSLQIINVPTPAAYPSGVFAIAAIKEETGAITQWIGPNPTLIPEDKGTDFTFEGSYTAALLSDNASAPPMAEGTNQLSFRLANNAASPGGEDLIATFSTFILAELVGSADQFGT